VQYEDFDQALKAGITAREDLAKTAKKAETPRHSCPR